MKALLLQQQNNDGELVWVVARSTTYFPHRDKPSLYDFNWLLYRNANGSVREFETFDDVFQYANKIKFDDTLVYCNDAKNDIF